jgi:hypothetical protein
MAGFPFLRCAPVLGGTRDGIPVALLHLRRNRTSFIACASFSCAENRSACAPPLLSTA